MTVADLPALRERNEERLNAAKEKLGTKWLLHPQNAARKMKDEENQTFQRIRVLK
jgi:hypothetical protein